MADKKALVNSGATNNFMHPAFANRWGWDYENSQLQRRVLILTILSTNQE
jgi:hypothetical protein